MNSKKLILVGIVAVILIILGFTLWPGDKRAIRKQVARMEELASKAPDEKAIDSLFRARNMAKLFHDPCTLEIEYADFVGEYSRKNIQDRIVLARNSFSQVKVSTHDLDISLLGNKQASLLCTLRITGKGAGSQVGDVQELEANLKKMDGDWLFTKLAMVEVLER
ncbi:hypothetical protein JWJ90_09550 [Desulfobulbus rhabdoformis]|uniref:hypothetical protein n=1 Tax=Desulfobulbus rhabdoformis TaxID=34032 RepID=UPI00196384EF|nr:hypothetical protein [Desulfobulbus rhabdoformis]MBM9614534.1 hypothetical protein [Desulfobulbus rhabdoformis]